MQHPFTPLTLDPFTITISDDTLHDLQVRLEKTRFPHMTEEGQWREGMDGKALQALVNHWRHFDWHTAQASINAIPAFRTTIDGFLLHFVYVRGQGASPIPIILTNGWPSCFTELLPLIPLLTQEVNGLSFDVVIPSLPGYGFSGKPTCPGTNITKIADLWAALMGGLGYECFLAHGSDMGAGIVERLRANHAHRLIGIHMVNVFRGYPPPADLTPEEVAFFERSQHWQMQEGAYAMLHASKPQTIAAALNDSPAGLAAWIGEKFYSWCDGEGAVSLDTLCTLLTIYWATGTIGSSLRLYREAFADEGAMSPPPKEGVPVGVAIFPQDILPAPRSWGERWLNIQRWTEFPKGGHFPGFEVPELLASELRAFAMELSNQEVPLRSSI